MVIQQMLDRGLFQLLIQVQVRTGMSSGIIGNRFMQGLLVPLLQPAFNCLSRQHRSGPVQSLCFFPQLVVKWIRQGQMEVSNIFLSGIFHAMNICQYFLPVNFGNYPAGAALLRQREAGGAGQVDEGFGVDADQDREEAGDHQGNDQAGGEAERSGLVFLADEHG